MAITTENGTFRANEIQKISSAGVVTNYVFTVGNWSKQSYTPESRVLPADPLYHPTARPLVYSRVTRFGRYRTGTSAYPVSYGYNAAWPRYDDFNQFAAPDTHIETKARLKFKNELTSLGETLFEYRQTGKMFHNAAGLVVDAWKVYRGKKGREKLSPCHVAASELVMSFGINPLLGVLSDSVTKLNERIGKAEFVRILRCTAKASLNGAGAYKSGYAEGGGPGQWRYSWDRHQKYTLVLRFGFPNHEGFTMGNPLEVAWELVPYSWLVDGLIDIGSWLASLDALDGVQQVVGTLTTRDLKKSTVYALSQPTYQLSKPGQFVEKTYKREVVTSVPLGRPHYVASSTWRKVMHATSALVVLNQRCRRTPRVAPPFSQ